MEGANMQMWVMREVPDPDGMLADLIEELRDNSALVEAIDSEVLAAAATLPGAEEPGFVDLWVDDDEFGEDFRVSVSIEAAANALRGLGYLVVHLGERP